MPALPESTNFHVVSIQTVYNLRWEFKGGFPSLRCSNVIEIPIAEPIARQYGNNTYTVTPYTAFVVENGFNIYPPTFVIETNEGVTVEPLVVHSPDVMYDTAYLLTLPRGTTGIKSVRITQGDEHMVPNDIIFDIMKAPYNYENYQSTKIYNDLVAFIQHTQDNINSLQNSIDALTVRIGDLRDRVTALENKAGV